ncbi:MAG: SGNH/GDSL hydrolase family protein [Eubacteriales bacterium]|nr:SGNH/GDSL hydrolase family protein [Eubacteriales bacterium]
MKKTIRKLTAVLLSFCMMLSLLSVSAFAATKEDVAQYGTYTSLGDSAVAGYGLPDWEAMKLRWGNPDWEGQLDQKVKETIDAMNLIATLQGQLDQVVQEGTEAYDARFNELKEKMLAEMTEEQMNELKYVNYTRRHEVYGSYPSVLAKAFGVAENLEDETAGTFHHYAQCAFRTEELRMMVDPSYKGDSEELVNIAAGMSNGSFSYANLLELQESGEYINAIKNSDIVTMSIGANDIYVPILGTVFNDLIALLLQKAQEEAAAQGETPKTEEEVTEDAANALVNIETEEDAKEVLGDVDTSALPEETTVEEANEGAEDLADNIDANNEASALQGIIALVAVLQQSDPNYIGKILKLALQCEVNYRINYGIIVNKIFEINPNVTLVAPAYTLNYAGFGALGPILKLVFGEMNLFVKARPNYNGHFITVALPDDQLTFTDISHPDEAGHALIAETILKALPTAKSVQGTTVKQGADGNWYAYTNGNYDETVNSVVKNALGWWKVENGKVNFKFNGIATNENGAWYLLGGKVQFLKTGYVRVDANGNQVLFGGTRYKVLGGKVQNYKG